MADKPAGAIDPDELLADIDGGGTGAAVLPPPVSPTPEPAADPVADTSPAASAPSPEPPTAASSTTGHPSERRERPVMAEDKHDEIPERLRNMSREELRAEALGLGRQINLVAKALRNKDQQEERERAEMSEAAATLTSLLGTGTVPPAPTATPTTAPAPVASLPNGTEALAKQAVELYDQSSHKDWKHVARTLADAGNTPEQLHAAIPVAKQMKGQ